MDMCKLQRVCVMAVPTKHSTGLFFRKVPNPVRLYFRLCGISQQESSLMLLSHLQA